MDKNRTQPPPVFGPNASLSSPNKASSTTRGYFGDITNSNVPITDATAGPSSLSSNNSANSKVPLPFAYTFKSVGGGNTTLSKKLHAHNDHTGTTPNALHASNAASGSYNPYSDVPEKALQPKVFVPHARTLGSTTVPRRVAVERKRREYATMVTETKGQEEETISTETTSSGLELLLREKEVDYNLPGGDASGSHGIEAALTLPLEAFDNHDYEIRSSKDWISLGIDEATNVQRGVPGIALCLSNDGSGYWRACRAVAWNENRQMFTIVWTEAPSATHSTNTASRTRSQLSAARDLDTTIESKEGDAKIAEEWLSVIPNAHGIDYVRRIHLCFAAEDPIMFVTRLASAFRARRDAAALIKYHLSLDCMPTDDGPMLQSVQLDRIQALSTAARSLQSTVGPAGSAALTAMLATREGKDRIASMNKCLIDLTNEAQTDFTRTMNRIIFDKTVTSARASKEPGNNEEMNQEMSGNGIDMLAAIELPPTPPAKPVPEIGLIRIPTHDYSGNKESFSFQSLYTRDEVISLLQRVSTENMKIYAKGVGAVTSGMLVGNPGKSVKLDEFEASNNTATNAYGNFLRDGWATIIRNHVRYCLGNVGKGHFNLRETNAKAYEYSKLRRLLRLIGYRMGDELRYSTDNQLLDFANAIQAACDISVHITSPSSVTVTTSTNTTFRRPPLFAVDVVIRDEAPPPAPAAEKTDDKKDGKKAKVVKAPTGPVKKIFGLSTPGTALASAPLTVFDNALKAISGIKAVERQVMDRLFWPEDPLIPTVNALEPHVVKLRENMATALNKAIHPLDAYVATFEPYVAFLNMDVDEMINGLKTKFAANGFSLPDCKTVIQKAKDSAAALLDDLPQTISLGFAFVSVAEVRQTLIKKHQLVAESVLKLVATTAAETSTDIIKQYDVMIKHLSAPTSDIESLTNIKEYMASCPDKIREQQGRTEANAQSYGLLESYTYALPKDQFDLQYKAVMGPSRVLKKIAEVEDALAKEKTKYMDEMAAEQTTFEDSLKDLTAEVGSLTSYKSMADVEGASIHVTRLKQSIDAAEEKARLFNTREGLFGKDITNYDSIGEIKKAFEPYYTLWDTAASWLKQHSSWMNDAFVNINAELIEREAGAMGRNMLRSVKAFEKIGNEGCLNVAKEIRDQTESFKPLIPLVIALRNPGMRSRHWAELSDAISEKN